MAMFVNDEIFPLDMKNDQVRKYFKESGVVDKLAEIFDKMFKAEEKIINPINFIREELGDTVIPLETMENLELEVDDAHHEIRRLRKILKRLGIENIDKELNRSAPSSKDFV